MTSVSYQIRSGTVQGVKHTQLGINNQDSVLVQEFAIPAWKMNYRIGLVSDGCSGIPAFSHSEVGANLLTAFCMARIQEFIIGGMRMEQIPVPLYHAVTSFLRDLANTVMPANIHWPYSIKFKDGHAFRNTLSAPQRFMTDYLAATIIGFVDDGTTLVTFQVGDGVIIINDTIHVVDQNDRPEYPAMSINTPGKGFMVNVYASANVQRIAVATDGIEKLLAMPELGLADLLFSATPGSSMGLQFLLNRLRKQYGVHMGDDCTVATMECIQGGAV